MIIDIDQLKRECADFGVEIDNLAAERFDTYARILIQWNEKMNLTAITEPNAVVTRHFADSLTFLSAVKPQENASLIDIGSGAGFPGLALKIARPDMDITLLDGTNKRITFLNAAANELGLQVNALHSRAEEAAVKPELREKHDFAVARAVAAMNLLSEYCLGFVKIGGKFIAMKGPNAEDELKSAQNAIKTMGGKSAGSTSLTLADGSERCILTVEKIAATPTGYPRVSAKIAKKPL